MPRKLIATLFIFMFSQLVAAETSGELPARQSLPDPLTLEQALALVDNSNPDVLLAMAGLESAKADLLLTESETDFYSFLDITAKTMQPTTTGEQENDSYARLVMNKTLYDFGRSSSQELSQSAMINRSEHLLKQSFLQNQFEVMRRFFNVLLADSRYIADNEDMVQKFLKFDKIRERASLGRLSEVEVKRAESIYREALTIRNASDRNRRSARLMLAIALNRPEELPGELVLPELNVVETEPPDAVALYQDVLVKSPLIRAMRQEVESVRTRVQAERARDYPTISAEVEVADWERATSTRGDYSAALTLRVPIYQGNRSGGEVARATADLSSISARLAKAEQDMMVTVFGLAKQLQDLKTERETARHKLAYRDLELDLRRAEYEMERQTSMSDAQANLTQANWQALKANIDTALVWARINVLLGNSPLAPVPKLKTPEPEETLP